MQSIQNLGLAIVSMLAGMILDARGYILLEVFFLALLCGALITGVVLYMWDAAKGNNKSIQWTIVCYSYVLAYSEGV